MADATLGKSIVLLQENKLMINGGEHHDQLAYLQNVLILFFFGGGVKKKDPQSKDPNNLQVCQLVWEDSCWHTDG